MKDIFYFLDSLKTAVPAQTGPAGATSTTVPLEPHVDATEPAAEPKQVSNNPTPKSATKQTRMMNTTFKELYKEYYDSVEAPEDYDHEAHCWAVAKLSAACSKHALATDDLAEYESEAGARRAERWMNGGNSDAYEKACLNFSVSLLILSRAYHAACPYLDYVHFEPYMVAELHRQEEELDRELEKEREKQKS